LPFFFGSQCAALDGGRLQYPGCDWRLRSAAARSSRASMRQPILLLVFSTIAGSWSTTKVQDLSKSMRPSLPPAVAGYEPGGLKMDEYESIGEQNAAGDEDAIGDVDLSARRASSESSTSAHSLTSRPAQRLPQSAIRRLDAGSGEAGSGDVGSGDATGSGDAAGSGGYDGSIDEPTSPPPMPPAPPPIPPVSPLASGETMIHVEATVIEVGLTLAGDVSSFDEAAQSSLAASLATTLGCQAPGCLLTLRVASASVQVTAVLTIPTAPTAGAGSTAAAAAAAAATTAAAVEAAATSLASQPAAALSSILGVTVTAAAPPVVGTAVAVLVVAPPPPLSPTTPPPSMPHAGASRGGSSAGVSAGVVVGATIGGTIAAILLAVAVFKVLCGAATVSSPDGPINPKQTKKYRLEPVVV